jgi:hypothetical protein
MGNCSCQHSHCACVPCLCLQHKVVAGSSPVKAFAFLFKTVLFVVRMHRRLSMVDWPRGSLLDVVDSLAPNQLGSKEHVEGGWLAVHAGLLMWSSVDKTKGYWMVERTTCVRHVRALFWCGGVYVSVCVCVCVCKCKCMCACAYARAGGRGWVRACI